MEAYLYIMVECPYCRSVMMHRADASGKESHIYCNFSGCQNEGVMYERPSIELKKVGDTAPPEQV